MSFTNVKAPMPRRVVVAFAVAPLVTPIAIAATGTLYLWLRSSPSAAPRALIAAGAHASVFSAFFGLPLAYVIEVAFGLPLYRWAQARPETRWRATFVLLVAAALGSVELPIIWGLLFGPLKSMSGLALVALLGLIVGATAGVVFALCVRPFQTRSAAI